ncbi:DUF61 family protein [Methanothermobacter wolfeii]|uniref:UPF0216 protein N5910_06760 n=1 Tax=Methanothermobacter wolfeii TaxID=145261 RepID=A0A9E7UMQ9_METWO|nr:DUF61 family protein [Methanothermobacter wolfeii]MDI6842670.1 DUF61 family protein [Methanothermobacter wolfeii]NLM01900.1 DUF61 family protein [Methanothermobacter wolfeii]UXH31237.1 DUF61 family protein [Methanothermobacter wolfeii]SCM57925.1 UPF0216 protein [Methanothermobacter wolfeii]
MRGDRSDRLLKKEIFNLNRHLPSRRKTLSELLNEDRPHVTGADGTRHRFKIAELEELAGMLTDDEIKRLRLPIYIEIDSETSGARIAGATEVRVVSEVLGRDDEGDEIYIYRPEIRVLRARFPTVTQYIFLVREL